MHIYPFRSEESTKNGSHQMSKKWSKMANQLPLAANAMALASLRDFILFIFFLLRLPICISLAFINYFFFALLFSLQ